MTFLFGQHHPVVPVNQQQSNPHEHNIRTLTFFYYLSGARAIIKEGIVFGCCVRVDWIATDILAQRDGFV